MGINKVVYGGKTLIDLTGDTVTADKLLEGVTAHFFWFWNKYVRRNGCSFRYLIGKNSLWERRKTDGFYD